MKQFIALVLARRTPVYFRVATVAMLCATRPVGAFAQLPTNKALAATGEEPYATCARNSPAPTTLTLSSTEVGKGVTATTQNPFFDRADADSMQTIGLTSYTAKGWAKVTGFIDSRHAIVEIQKPFESLYAGEYAWGRWPFCYMDHPLATVRGKYGFNTGSDHQKGNNTPGLILDRRQRYSVDRCSFAHDSKYWGDGCNNDHWVEFCWQKVWPQTVEEEAALNYKSPTRFPDLWMFKIGRPNPCKKKIPWVDLPISAKDIACYGDSNSGEHYLVGVNNLVLDVKVWESGNEPTVVLWPVRSECNKKWRMVAGTGNPAKYGYEIRGPRGRCLGTAPGRRPKSGDVVQMWNCAGRYTEKWHHEHGQLRVQDKRTPRLCLDVKSDGEPLDVIVWKCASTNPGRNPGQQWRFATQ